MKEKFIDHKFNTASLELVETANGILNEYREMGYRLSLRQLYYQLVARDYIENSVKSYKRIGNLISDARLAGLIDWGMIEDRNRETVIPTEWTSPAQIVRAAASQFRVDRWEGQTHPAGSTLSARRASTDETVEERIPMFTKYMGAAVHGHGHYQKSAAMSGNKHYAT